MTDPKKPAPLGSFANLDLITGSGDGNLYLTTWNTSTLKGELHAVAVDGSGKKKLWELGPEKSAKDGISSIAVDEGVIYFTQSGKVMRLALAGGTPETVAESFGTSVVPSGEYLYGIRYDEAGKRDIALRIAKKGGPAEELYARPREGGGERPGFTALAADEHHVFIADSGKRTLVSVDLASKAVTELATGLAYPNGVRVVGTDVFVTTQTTGVYRAPIAGGKAQEVSGKGDKVDAMYGFDAAFLYAYDEPGPADDGPAFLPLSRVAIGGGKAEPLHSVKANLSQFVVGDDCLYLVFRDETYSIMAYSKTAKP